MVSPGHIGGRLGVGRLLPGKRVKTIYHPEYVKQVLCQAKKSFFLHSSTNAYNYLFLNALSSGGYPLNPPPILH